MTDSRNPHIVERASPLPFDDTIERLVHTIEDGGMTIFARIDHAANARSVGLSMPPATVLIYGAAKGGTPVMLAHPLAALDLPLRVLVREGEDGITLVAFHPITELLGGVGTPLAMSNLLAPAQERLLKALEA